MTSPSSHMVIIEPYSIYGGTSPNETDPNKQLKFWHFSFFDNVPFSVRKVTYLFGFLNLNNFHEYLFPFIPYHTEWKTPGKMIDRYVHAISTPKEPLELEDGGYLPIQYPIFPGEISYSPTEEVSSCPVADMENRLAIFDQLLDNNQTTQNKLMLLEAPVYTNRYKTCQEMTNSLTNQYSTHYVKLFNNHELTDLLFGDEAHLSQFGAIIASVRAAEIISEEINITPDPIAIEYYESYFFSDYLLTLENNRVTISLTPIYPQYVGSLSFEWKAFQNGKLIPTKTDGNGIDNQFSFILPDPTKEYEINVVINNPAGDYELIGIFQIPKP